MPPQPGLSSSAAAVTILPDVPKLAKAWRTWYKHVGLLRRLRFIRSLIAKKRYYEIDEVSDISESDEEANTADAVDTEVYLSLGNFVLGGSFFCVFILLKVGSTGVRVVSGMGGGGRLVSGGSFFCLFILCVSSTVRVACSVGYQ